MFKNALLSLIIFFILTTIVQAQFSISIDAQKDFFYNELSGAENGFLILSYHDYLSLSGPKPDGDKDLSAKVWMAWDSSYFYLYAEVRDDMIRVNHSARPNNDCMELKFDPDPTLKPLTGIVNARMSAVDSAEAKNMTGVDNLYSEGNLDSAAVSPVNYARRPLPDGYVLELRLAWNWIKTEDRQLHAGEGNLFGLAINFHDNDSDARDGSIHWSAGMADEVWTTPQLLGTVEFLPDHKFKLIKQNAIDPDARPGYTYLSKPRLERDPGPELILENWKYHPGDDSAWVDPTYDDSSWETYHPVISKQRQPQSGWKAIGWFRIHLVVDSSLWGIPLGLVMFQTGASEIYLDGDLLYRFGKVSSNPDSEEIHWERDPRYIVFRDSSNHLLAVRYSNTATDKFIDKTLNAGYLCLIWEDLVPLISERVKIVRDLSLFQIIFTTIAVVLGILHLFIFLFYPSAKENLYFSIFIFCWAVITFTEFSELFSSDFNQIILHGTLGALAISPAIIFGLLTIYASVYHKIPRQILLFIATAPLFTVGILFSLFEPKILSILIYGFFGLATLETFRILIFSRFRQQRSRWILLSGFSIFMLFLVYQILSNMQILPRFGEYGIVYVYGIFILVISMSIDLSRNFAQTSRNLEKQLIQVKELSEKTLAQERQARDEEMARKLLEADNARKTMELKEARKLQLSMLPQKIPSLPNMDIAAYMQPANEVGGDYYDFYVAEDGTLTITIGDATGHGMKAGTMVATIKALFSAFGGTLDILPFFSKCSEVLKNMNLGNLYMALMLVRIKEYKMISSSAGMPPMFIYRNKSQNIEEIVLKGMPLGAHVGFPYLQKETELAVGDTILLMSDGFPELFNEKKETLGYTKVKKSFKSVADKSPGQIIEHLNKYSQQWRDNTPQNDDITFVVLKIKNSKTSS
jgi:serine phosphatase RsbU (regulator of sigma subunit)